MATRNQKKQGNGRSDYIEFGSEKHAQLLQLRKATKSDDPELIVDGYTFMDFTQYGANANERFLKAVLNQRVRELKAKPTVPQSDDRMKPNYAPPMFNPDDFRKKSVSSSEIDEAIMTLRRAGLV